MREWTRGLANALIEYVSPLVRADTARAIAGALAEQGVDMNPETLEVRAAPPPPVAVPDRAFQPARVSPAPGGAFRPVASTEVPPGLVEVPPPVPNGHAPGTFATINDVRAIVEQALAVYMRPAMAQGVGAQAPVAPWSRIDQSDRMTRIAQVLLRQEEDARRRRTV